LATQFEDKQITETHMKHSTILALGAGSLAGFVAARAYRSNRKVHMPMRGKHVVILGGGFGGLSAASRLIEMAGTQVRVTLIDQHNYHLFTPMLYQVATCGVVPYDVAIPLRSFTGPRGIRFRKATVQRVEFENKSVQTMAGGQLRLPDPCPAQHHQIARPQSLARKNGCYSNAVPGFRSHHPAHLLTSRMRLRCRYTQWDTKSLLRFD
jgi:hypothetical protein